jgi:hypothetical protein
MNMYEVYALHNCLRVLVQLIVSFTHREQSLFGVTYINILKKEIYNLKYTGIKNEVSRNK